MRLLLLLPALLLAALTHTPARAQVTLNAPGQPATTITAEQLQALPQAEATIGAPPNQRHAQGPLLWTVLTASHLVDPARHGDAVRQTIRLQGADNYVAIIAMGELSPDFEDKPAVLALSMDGKPLDRPRAVIPGDHRGGRGVHDIVSISLNELPKP